MNYWYKEPLFHFLLIGLLLFSTSSIFKNTKNETSKSNQIIITKETLNSIIKNYKHNTHNIPDKYKIDELLAKYIEEEVLFREALNMKLYRSDPIVRNTLIQKMRYLSNDKIDIDKATKEELYSFFLKHRNKFIESERISFIHIFINPNKHRKNTPKLANKIYTNVYNHLPKDINFTKLGDHFKGGNYFEEKSQNDLSNHFDRSFIRQLFKMSTNTWSKPIASGYGTHIVYIFNHFKSKNASFDKAYKQIKYEWIIAESQNAYKQYILNLKKKYNIKIENNNKNKEATSEIDVLSKK